MGDTAANSREAAFSLARVLAEHRAADVVVLDVSTLAGWTDYFVIGTATSGGHLRGLYRFVEEAVTELKLERFNRPSVADDDEWLLADLGTVVVHLMTAHSRAFYELEKLWFQAVAARVEPSIPEPTAAP